MSYHQYGKIFHNPKNALQFVAACDLAVMSGNWRCDNPHMDPRPLINTVREQLTQYVRETSSTFEPLSTCYLADLVIAAFTTRYLNNRNLVIKLLIELDAEVSKEERNIDTRLGDVGMASYSLGCALISPEQRNMLDSKNYLAE